MYTTQIRLARVANGRQSTYNKSTKTTTVTRYDGKMDLECVYSFRTGKGQREALASNAFTSFRPFGANLASKLASRKEYLEGISNSVAGRSGAKAVYTQDRTNTFIRVRNRTVGSITAVVETNRNSSSSGGITTTHMPYQGFPAVPPDARMTTLLSTTLGGKTVGPSRAIMQNYGSSSHYAINPFRQAVGIGETIHEIVSGNIPKLTSELFRSISKGSFLDILKKAPKGASQDYLNAQFGIGPILEDLYKMLIQGITLHDSLYGSSYRRSRSSSLVDDHWQSNRITLPGNYFYKDGYIGPPTSRIVTPADGPTLRMDYSIIYDMRFKARFTLARASSEADRRYNQALELVRAYGLWTPKLLWDILPWSWMVDWFLNFGRGFVNAYDYGKDGGLKSDYACVTAKTTTLASHTGFATDVINGTRHSKWRGTSMHSVTDTLYRIPVNPFGQSVQLASMSSWQRSILVALGIAKTF